jgi:hypothetical protein
MRNREGGTLALNPKPAFGFRSAANPELLPQAKPRAKRKHFVVPSIGSREVTWAQRSNVRRFEHFLQLLNVVDDAFNVHSVSISDMRVAFVKQGGISKDLDCAISSRSASDHPPEVPTTPRVKCKWCL